MVGLSEKHEIQAAGPVRSGAAHTLQALGGAMFNEETGCVNKPEKALE